MAETTKLVNNMAFENLSEREKAILTNLINYYITTADPVGSRVIANKFNMGISSATIRNTLHDLEEIGLVQQPHTSAGRIPTDLGYRVYVDYLLKPEELTEEEKKIIKETLLREGRGINEVLGQTSKVLSQITNQLGVSIAPRFKRGVLKRLNLIPITSERVMVVIVLESGLARSVVLEIEVSFNDLELIEVEKILNERLAGLSLGEINETISERMASVSGHGKLIKLFIDSKDKIWTESKAEDIKVFGAENLVKKPEFSDLLRVSELVKLLEDGNILSEFISKVETEGLFITIGAENQFKEVLGCSLVTSQYKVGNVVGTIGIVGPTRMEYNKLISVVDYTARTISDMLSGIKSDKEH